MNIEISPINLSSPLVLVCRAVSYLMWAAALLLTVFYLVNATCVAVDPNRPIFGTMTHMVTKNANGGESTISSYSGITRAFIKAAPKDGTGYVKLGGTSLALPNMTIGSWVFYLLYLTLATGAALLLAISLARLFGGLARGMIFTQCSIRRIKMTGIAVALGTLIQFLDGFFAMGINRFSNSSPLSFPGQVYGSQTDLPLAGLVIAIMIILIAAMFEEGRKLSEDAALTV